MQTTPPAWISTADVEAQLQLEGSSVTSRQLERWRSDGLLPPVIQIGAGAGSVIWHPPVTARQAVAIERALAAKNRVAFAGEVLWAAGFEVDDRHWRPQLEQSRATMARVGKFARRLAADDDRPDTFGDRLAAESLTGQISKIARRLGKEQMARFANVTLEILQGDFQAEEDSRYGGEEVTTLGVALRGLDLEAGDDDRVMGQGFSFSRAVGDLLRLASGATLDDQSWHFSEAEVRQACDDVRNGFKIAVCMHEALAWIYGPKALGLGLASSMGKAATPALLRTYSLAFARLRHEPNDFLTSSEIARLASQAEGIWLMSTWLRDLQDQRPELRKFIGPKALKIALTDSPRFRKLLKELGGCEFPAPDFRPWNQWARLSKKTTIQTGLLAMSIGAPTRLEAADVLPRESAAANL